MSQRKENSLKFVAPKKEREDFKVIGAARLFKRKDMKPQDAWGISFKPLLPDGKEDRTADSYLIWFSAINALKAGEIYVANVHLVPYKEQEKTE